MSEPEKFLDRWSRRKREAADEPAPVEAKDADRGSAAAAAVESAGRGGPIRSRQPAADRIDQRGIRHSRLSQTRRSAGTLACGASPRLVGRSGDPRLHRPGRERRGISTIPTACPALGRSRPTRCAVCWRNWSVRRRRRRKLTRRSKPPTRQAMPNKIRRRPLIPGRRSSCRKISRRQMQELAAAEQRFRAEQRRRCCIAK